MTRQNDIDFSSLGGFRASGLSDEEVAETGGPNAAVQVRLALIDTDSRQPRRRFNTSSLEELAESIREHGVLEPVSVRRHPDHLGRYLVNRGERRVRAAVLCGLATVPAFVDERVDPFAQAAENLHREDMSALDLAQFIREREQEGRSRAEIARRLAKPRSFITEAATLSEASPALLEAVKAGRVAEDVRTLYRLVLLEREQPDAVHALLEGSDNIDRAEVDSLVRKRKAEQPQDGGSKTAAAGTENKAGPATSPSAGRTVLIVEHEGRRGALRLKASDDGFGDVRFGDGSRDRLPLNALKNVCWATEDARW